MTSNQHGPAVVEKAAPPQFTLLQLLVCLSLIGIVLGACRLATHLDPAAAALVDDRTPPNVVNGLITYRGREQLPANLAVPDDESP